MLTGMITMYVGSDEGFYTHNIWNRHWCYIENTELVTTVYIMLQSKKCITQVLQYTKILYTYRSKNATDLK